MAVHFTRTLRARNIMSSAAGVAVAVLGASMARADVSGFGGSTNTGWQLNANAAATTAGVPNVAGTGTTADVLQITSTAAGESTSYWNTTAQSVTNFVAAFTYTDVSTNGADGFSFVLQNQGTNALGGSGGNIGYTGITTAAGDVFNTYSGNSGSGSGYNATVTAGNPIFAPTPGGVNIDSGHAINVTLSYRQADNAMVETLTDTVTNATYTRAYRGIDIQSAVGSNTALIGFTGGTGGATSNQTITNFTYTTGSAPAPPVAAFQPINAMGYNQNMIISKASGGSLVTATMDGGTAKTGNTFYELGVNTGSSATGLPAGGAIFGSANDANHVFKFQSYSGNNAVMLDSSNTTGTLTLGGTTSYSALSFLLSEGNGGSTFNAVIHFVGAPDQTYTGIAPDWFNGSPIAFDANGRETLAGGFGNVGSGNPRLYQADITLTDTTDPISSIDLSFVPTTNGTNRTAIFGLSGISTPEPASLSLMGLGALGLLARRRRA
ncbi:MAG: hypothetical protein JWN24_1292 [Phycisphaerales bacterium]|nr:hypothetical protein [Phycisphaerales bacterium]